MGDFGALSALFTPQNMTMANPNGLLGNTELFSQMTNQTPVGDMAGGLLAQAGEPSFLGTLGKNISEIGGNIGEGVGDFGSALMKKAGEASLDEYGKLLSGAGDIYKAVQNKGLLEQQIKDMKADRAYAEEERNRKRDFLGTTASTFGGGNTSNYYSA